MFALPEQLVAQTTPAQQTSSATTESPAAVTPSRQTATLNQTSAQDSNRNPATSQPPTNTPATDSTATDSTATVEKRSPQTIAAVLDPSLTNPVLPSLGDANVYLPSEADALGMHLIVKLSDRRVYVYKGDKAIVSYPIAIGKPGWETPVGTYKVLSMEKNPIFKSFKSGAIIHPGPENPLGVRWIGIWTDGKTQLGFHGTNQPELIGQAVSHGCIRMYNKDVVALYEQVAPGMTVKVEP